MSFENVPSELKSLIQWCVWRYEKTDNPAKPTKVPYHPKTGRHMSVSDPQTWCSFSEAVAGAADWNKYNGIGFVFTSRDPYCGIDLDASEDPAISARQQAIFEAFNSYSELSPSGRGLHIIIKANVPHGRKRDAVEIYSSARFFTMTGNVYRNVPIADHNAIANDLWGEMAPPKATTGNYISSLYQDQEDKEIYDTAASAANGDKFEALWRGDWQQYYSSQSEADFALVDIIAYYTQFIPQISRMFRLSALGQRDKARREDYMSRMIERSFDNQPPALDISAILDQLEAAKAAMTAKPLLSGGPASDPNPARVTVGGLEAGRSDRTSHAATPAPQSPPSSINDINLEAWRQSPPGLLGQLVNYFMASSPRPVYEISLVAALGLMSGIVGRQYNVSATGLNQYVMLIADTGKGKEAINAGISRLVSAVAKTHKAAERIIGPADIASGQALLKHIGDRDPPCFVSIVGEFGIKLRQVTDANANSADRTLLKVLLDLYAKSGAGMVLHPSIYADKKNNTEAINSPAFTMIGESTGERFYEALDETNVADGLLPRFLIVEYNGYRVPFNKHHASIPIPVNLIEAISGLILHCDMLAQNKTAITIGIYPDAENMLDWLNEYCDDQINHSNREVTRHIWNRVHLKVYKLAGLLAVAHNVDQPFIDADMVRWATSLVVGDAKHLLGKFDRGEMGIKDDAAYRSEIIRKELYKYYFDSSELTTIDRNLHSNNYVSWSWLQSRCASKRAFRGGNPTNNFNAEIKSMIDNGQLAMVKTDNLKLIGAGLGRTVIVTDMKWLTEGH